LSRRRRANRAEDAGSDHRADRQHDQVARAQHALQRMRVAAGRLEIFDRLARE
jgi:hypothetical protein